ncbi:hypothetical protein ACH347_09860 [Saccharopolyspora sp. 5N102]|uniref:hypothetical protein n=1 Tax=Saccharopolyspora sp. 5N102 TaxID=3375155 RepID=UPI00379F63D2
MLVGGTHLLAFGPGDFQEVPEQPGCGERRLAGVLLHVQGAALVAGVRGGVALVDGGCEPGSLQDAGQQ